MGVEIIRIPLKALTSLPQQKLYCIDVKQCVLSWSSGFKNVLLSDWIPLNSAGADQFGPFTCGTAPGNTSVMYEALSNIVSGLRCSFLCYMEGKPRQWVKRNSLNFCIEPIGPFTYWHSQMQYKSRQTALTTALVMNSSSQQHIDLLLSLINVKLFSSSDRQRTSGYQCFPFQRSQLLLVFIYTCFLFHAYFIFQTLVCMAALALPSHSWRRDGYGESVGQQPWNKYGWSWVRWVRIICFAICLYASVDVMSVVLPCPLSPLTPGRLLTEMHSYRTCKVTHTHTTLRVHNHSCVQTELHTKHHRFST